MRSANDCDFARSRYYCRKAQRRTHQCQRQWLAPLQLDAPLSANQISVSKGEKKTHTCDCEKAPSWHILRLNFCDSFDSRQHCFAFLRHLRLLHLIEYTHRTAIDHSKTVELEHKTFPPFAPAKYLLWKCLQLLLLVHCFDVLFVTNNEMKGMVSLCP